jgi:hypothetical protein
MRSELHFDVNSIVFGDGVPVGGSAHLRLFQDGNSAFSGNFHDSGFVSFDVCLVWAIKDSRHNVYTFTRAGHVAGTVEPGSRDFSWNLEQRNDAIAQNWISLVKYNRGRLDASATLDLGNLFDTVIKAIGVVQKVIAVV